MVTADTETPPEDDAAAVSADDPAVAAEEGLADVLAEAADVFAADQPQEPAPVVDGEPEGPAPIPSEAILEDLAEVEDVVDVVALATELAETKDRLLRAMAETENIRRRAERDKAETAKYAVTNFARDMLSVADNVRRALDTIDADLRKESQAMENLVVGLEMVERETVTTLERHGVKPIAAIGERFNSNLHEALYEIPDPSQPAGNVGQVVETGYTLHDRLLRPAKVGVTKEGPKAEPKSAAADAPADAAAKGAKSAYEGAQGAQGERLDESL